MFCLGSSNDICTSDFQEKIIQKGYGDQINS